MKLTKQEIADKLNADKDLMKRLSEITEVEREDGTITKLEPDDHLYWAHGDLGPKTVVRFTCWNGGIIDEKVTVLNRLLGGVT